MQIMSGGECECACAGMACAVRHIHACHILKYQRSGSFSVLVAATTLQSQAAKHNMAPCHDDAVT